MSNQGTAEAAGGVSRSGRVRKKSTKLMESMEIAKNIKPDRPIVKSPADKGVTLPDTSSPEMISIKTEPVFGSDVEEMEELTDAVPSEQLPLSAEGLPLAVPASGYYTYQGQFSDVLPKPEPKFHQKKMKEGIDQTTSPASDNEFKQAGVFIFFAIE